MAPEFYDTLPQHESWVRVIYDFIMDPNIGPYARMVRERNVEAEGMDKPNTGAGEYPESSPVELKNKDE